MELPFFHIEMVSALWLQDDYQFGFPGYWQFAHGEVTFGRQRVRESRERMRETSMLQNMCLQMGDFQQCSVYNH